MWNYMQKRIFSQHINYIILTAYLFKQLGTTCEKENIFTTYQLHHTHRISPHITWTDMKKEHIHAIHLHHPYRMTEIVMERHATSPKVLPSFPQTVQQEPHCGTICAPLHSCKISRKWNVMEYCAFKIALCTLNCTVPAYG